MLGEMSSRNIRDLGRTWIIRVELDSDHPELWGHGGRIATNLLQETQ